jgi:hypothetical protein
MNGLQLMSIRVIEGNRSEENSIRVSEILEQIVGEILNSRVTSSTIIVIIIVLIIKLPSFPSECSSLHPFHPSSAGAFRLKVHEDCMFSCSGYIASFDAMDENLYGNSFMEQKCKLHKFIKFLDLKDIHVQPLN